MAVKGKDYDIDIEMKEEMLHKQLENILDRLNNDVEPYVKYIQEELVKNSRGVGNFALIRMLTPIIETVASSLNKKPQEILKELSIDFPFLYWSIFRDVFAHNDEFQSAHVIIDGESITIYPTISLGSSRHTGGHNAVKDHAAITPTMLFWDLKDLIKDYLANTDDRKIRVAKGITYYPENNDPEVCKIVEEVRLIQG